jgi:hypothetical protein
MKIVKCKSCGADIFWIKYKEKNHPLNAKPKKVFVASEFPDGTVWSFRSGYESHYSSCPQASSWRKKNGDK